MNVCKPALSLPSDLIQYCISTTELYTPTHANVCKRPAASANGVTVWRPYSGNTTSHKAWGTLLNIVVASSKLSDGCSQYERSQRVLHVREVFLDPHVALEWSLSSGIVVYKNSIRKFKTITLQKPPNVVRDSPHHWIPPIRLKTRPAISTQTAALLMDKTCGDLRTHRRTQTGNTISALSPAKGHFRPAFRFAQNWEEQVQRWQLPLDDGFQRRLTTGLTDTQEAGELPACLPARSSITRLQQQAKGLGVQ